jgi:phosphatidylethanolamine-binding protein (PEBP) family uncharacterized protein
MRGEEIAIWAPRGKRRYSFTIYALNAVLRADSNMNKKELLKAIEDHILARAHLAGYYPMELKFGRRAPKTQKKERVGD